MLAKWRSTAFGVMLPVLAPAPLLAQQPTFRVSLDYRRETAPDDCPSSVELRAAIVRQLGRDPFTDSASERDYDVRVEIARTGAGAEAHIEWLDATGRLEGERRLSSESDQCLELASGVAFAIAVQLQLRAANIPARPPEPPPPARKPRPRPRALPRPSRAVLAGVGVFAQRGTQPGSSVGLSSFGAVRARHWSLGLGAHATLPTVERTETGAGFSARELGLSLAPCFRSGSLDACALGSLGLLAVRGEGVDEVRTPTAPLVGVGLRLQLVLPELDRVAALTHVDVLALLTPRDVLLNGEKVWSTAPIAVGLGLDLAAIFR